MKYLLLFIWVLFSYKAFSQELRDSSSSSNVIRIDPNSLTTNIIPEGTNSANGYFGNAHLLQRIPYCSPSSSISFSLYPPSYCPQNATLGLNTEAVDFMNNHLNRCVAYSLQQIGIRKPFARVNIAGQGAHFRKISSNGRASMHTSGAAIDINSLNITFRNGETETFPASAVDFNGRPFPGFTRCRTNCGNRKWNMDGKALFYHHFETCLKQAINKIRYDNLPLMCSGGLLGPHDNHDHANHIHLSIPVCPKIPNYNSI